MQVDPSIFMESVPKFVRKFQKKGQKTWLFWLLVFGLLGGGSYAIARAINIVPYRKATEGILSVPVKRQSLPITVSASGTVKPERSINISPKTSGVLKSLLVQEGDTVKKGQIIAYMDNSNVQGQLLEAKGKVASAQANLQKLRSGNRSQEIAQAQARLSRTQATLIQAEDDLRRHESLYRAGAISRQSFNQKRTDRDTAKAQVMEAQQALALQKAGARAEDIAQASGEVTSAIGSLQNIQTQIEDTKIVAPFNGVVSKKFADPGAFVTPTTAGSDVSSATSSTILSLASDNQIVVNVAETNIAQIRLGQKVVIQADAYPDKKFEGRVTQIAIQATLEQNVTSFEVKIAIISDPEKLLLSGMNVDVDFQVGQLNNALLVPTVAIVRQQNATGVFVVTDDKFVFTSIKTGVTVDNKTEVKSGLKGNEKISLGSPPE
jgi:HlyD family secretion protein